MDTVKLLTLTIVLCMGLRGVQPRKEPPLPMTAEEYDLYINMNPVAAEFTKFNGNITDMELALPNWELPSQQDLKCYADMAELMKGLTARKIWALRSK